jgi:phosphatidylglycerol:prolipoprotein diacylglycerol transferase
MEFERSFISLTLDNLRLYGIGVAVLILLVAALSAWQESRRGAERRQIYLGFGITAAIAVAVAVIWYLLVPAGTQELNIRYYGIIIVLGMIVATFVARYLASSVGKDPEHVYGALTWAIIPGIILARLWFVTFPPETMVEAGFDRAYYYSNFFDLNNGAIAIWSGGLSIFGAVLGGLLGTLLYLRRNRLPVAPWLDIAAISLPVAQSIGRWANFVNQELYGIPTELPWGIAIDQEILRGTEYGAIEYFGARFHPLFLYESLWSLAAFFVLFFLYTQRRSAFRAGDFFLLYIAQYSFIRFLLEFIRVEVTMVGGVNLSQVVTAALFIFAVAAFVYRHRPGVSGGYDLGPSRPVNTDRVQQRQEPASENA